MTSPSQVLSSVNRIYRQDLMDFWRSLGISLLQQDLVAERVFLPEGLLEWFACRFLNAFVFCLISVFVVVFIHERGEFVRNTQSLFGTLFQLRHVLVHAFPSASGWVTEVTGSSLLLYGLLWSCSPLPLIAFPTETAILLTCLSEYSGLSSVSLSFAWVSQMFPLGGSYLSSLEIIESNSNVSEVSSARETLFGEKANSLITSEWSLPVDKTLSLDVSWWLRLLTF